ncbi:hypothetical protein [uncultured Tateyamaria sp.]|uniref:hypothetical protein n=1 Tax=uncultured Tateyamaria sp. TaxID=455651 RepID=UPI002627994A|nr:hypothetical protein [uncultured Tateyamaria sp.]
MLNDCKTLRILAILMHFHWDNFDTFARRALRVFAPPLVNFIILLIVFNNAVSGALNWMWGAISTTLAASLRQSVPEEMPERSNPEDVEQVWSALAAALEAVAMQLSKAEVSWPTLNAIGGNIFSGIGSAAYVAVITSLISLLVLAFILDWGLRGFALLLPIRLRTKERELVHHTRYSDGFEKIMQLLNVDHRVRDPKTGKFKKGSRQVCRHELWTRIQAILDGKVESGHQYRHAREAILLSIDENRKWFCYFIAYAGLFLYVSLSSTVDFPEFFSWHYQVGGAALMVVFGAISVLRHIQLSFELVDLDIEACLGFSDLSETSHTLSDANIDNHSDWKRVVAFWGWSNRDPRSMFFCK